jgi:hypothetical protein
MCCCALVLPMVHCSCCLCIPFPAHLLVFICLTYVHTMMLLARLTVSSCCCCCCCCCCYSLFPPPTGINSTGGPIASAGAAYTPSAQPVTRCTDAPPAVANAMPWNNRTCTSLRTTNRQCTTTCAAGVQAQPANASITARCTAGGVWQVTGTCVAAAAACKGTPDAGANANAFTNCTDGNAGSACTSQRVFLSVCLDGGTPAAARSLAGRT